MVTDVIEYVRRYTLNIANLNSTHNRKHRSGPYQLFRQNFGFSCHIHESNAMLHISNIRQGNAQKANVIAVHACDNRIAIFI